VSIRFESKMLTPTQALAWRELVASAGPVVFTNGVFDLLHRGHVSYLDEAAQLGSALIVAVNSDASAKRLGKGPERPLNTVEDRMAMLASLASVTAVTQFDEDTPYSLIEKLRPNIIVKGGDYDMEALPETKLVRSWGGQAVSIVFRFERSTTELVRRIRES